MRYRLTCLTPLLVGDGRKLSPIDYMVWKDQVNVLDQRRIFRLLAKGPRLDGYLAQLKRADKLDFASWGGFAQNFADRRIPFESPACSTYWNRAAGDSLHIPTFAAGASGPYLPGAAIKGALRTGWWRPTGGKACCGRWPGVFRASARRAIPRSRSRSRWWGRRAQPACAWWPRAIRRRSRWGISASICCAFPRWRRAPAASRWAGSRARAARWTARGPKRARHGLPRWRHRARCSKESGTSAPFFLQPEVRRAVRWPEGFGRGRLFDAANEHAARLLGMQKQYAVWASLDLLKGQVEELEARLAEARQQGACLLSLGWGGGLLSKSAWLDTANPEYRQHSATCGAVQPGHGVESAVSEDPAHRFSEQ